MAIYREAAGILLECCSRYRNRVERLDELKAAVWSTAQEILATEERDLHEFLKGAEGCLDLVEYTTDESRVFEETLLVVDNVESRLREYLDEED